MVAPAWALPTGPKLLIGILHHGTVSLDWARMFATLQRPGPTIYSYSSHWPFDVSRNAICNSVLQHNAEWLFFLDSDVIPQDDAILRLMRHNLPIVSGVYHSKVPPHLPLVLRRAPQQQPDGSVKSVLTNIQQWAPGEILQVDAVATGLLLIHRRVLERFKEEGIEPFEWTLGRKARTRDYLKLSDADIKKVDTLFEAIRTSPSPELGPFGTVEATEVREILERALARLKLEPEPEGLSEDFDFGVKAKALGFPLHVDTSVVAAHAVEAKLVGPPTGAGGGMTRMETP